MNLKELKKAFENETPVSYKREKCIILEVEHTLFGDFKASVRLCVVNHYPSLTIDFLSEKELEAFSLWEKPITPFHQECIDLLKDYNYNRELLNALNLIKAKIKNAIKETGCIEHKFYHVTNPFICGYNERLQVLQLLAKELPYKYDFATDTWTFYTSPSINL